MNKKSWKTELTEMMKCAEAGLRTAYVNPAPITLVGVSIANGEPTGGEYTDAIDVIINADVNIGGLGEHNPKTAASRIADAMFKKIEPVSQHDYIVLTVRADDSNYVSLSYSTHNHCHLTLVGDINSKTASVTRSLAVEGLDFVNFDFGDDVTVDKDGNPVCALCFVSMDSNRSAVLCDECLEGLG